MSDRYNFIPLRSHLQTYTAGENRTNQVFQESEVDNNNCVPARSHLQSYTAGEEESRLSQVAKTFGLIGNRQRRKPVRLFQSLGKGSLLVAEQVNAIIQDSTFEKAVGFFTEHFDCKNDENHTVISLTDEDDDLSVFDDTINIRKFSLDGAAFIDEEQQKQRSSGGYGDSLAPVVLGTIKGLAGATILYFSYGFSLSGYAFALPCLFIITIMYLYSSEKLLECWKIEKEKMKYFSSIDEALLSPGKMNGYGATNDFSPINYERKQPHITFKESRRSSSLKQKQPQQSPISYPELAYRAFGSNGERIVRLGIALMQLGHILTYFIFVSQNLHHSMKELFSMDIPFWVFVVIMACVEIPLTCIRDIRRLTLTNIISLSLIVFGLTSCLGYALFGTNSDDSGNDSFIERLTHLEPIKNRWYLFVGTCVFLFQGSISLCLPFQEAVEGQQNGHKFPKVYKATISCVVLFLSIFSIICWTAFGPSVKIVLTNSLPEGIFPNFVRFAYSVAIMFSFPLIGFPALEIICHAITPYISDASSSSKLSSSKRALITSTTIICVSIIAIVEMDNLGHVVSLIGSLLGCPIVFVIPPLIHNKLAIHDTSVASSKQCFMNYLVAGIGVVIMVFASLTTLLTWNSQDAAV